MSTPLSGHDLATHIVGNVSRYFLLHTHLLEQFNLKLSACTANSQPSGFQSVTSCQNSMPSYIILQRSISASSSRGLSSASCTALMMLDRSVYRAAFFCGWSEFPIAENTNPDRVWTGPWRHPAGNLSRNFSCRQQLQSPPLVILVALLTSPLSSFLLSSSRSLSASSRLASIFSWNVSASMI